MESLETPVGIYIRVYRFIYSSSATLLDGACRFLVCFCLFFYAFIFSFVKVFCCAFFVFFVFQAVECLLQQTSASDAEREVTGVQVAGGSAKVLDSGVTDTQPDLAQAVHLESNPADQTSDSQLFDHDDAVRCFENIIKIEDLFLPSFEVESVSLVQGKVPPGVKGRLKAQVLFWEKIGAPPFIIDCIREGYKIPFYVSPPSAEI